VAWALGFSGEHTMWVSSVSPVHIDKGTGKKVSLQTMGRTWKGTTELAEGTAGSTEGRVRSEKGLWGAWWGREGHRESSRKTGAPEDGAAESA
jgi:hypothetical protein